MAIARRLARPPGGADNHARMRLVPPSAALLLAALGPGCAYLGSGSVGVTLSTDPPGARVWIDGRDSGFVTPCRLALESGEDYRVELALEGYVTAAYRVEADTDAHTVLWKDMYIRPEVWNAPLWLDLEGSLEPVRVTRTLSPARIFARLERAADR